MAERKHFGLDEVNAIIPQMEMLIEKMQRIHSRVRQEMQIASEGLETTGTQKQLLERRPGLRPLFEDMAHAVQTIEEQGGLFKGLELGLVDFPSLLNGQEVYLCWQYGEKEVSYFHKVTEGFSGRQRLEEQSQKPQYYQ